MRPGSRPQLADRINFGLASSMRVASSVACESAEHHGMHGTDAGASQHGDHRLRHHRHVENDAVALLDTEVAQDRSQHLGFHLQMVVGDRALLGGERGIVDDRRLLAAALHHMPIDRVPAGVADAPGEPATVNPGGGIEHLLRRLDPVYGLRGLGPKALGIALPAPIDLVIAARAGIHGAAPGRLPYCEAARYHCKARKALPSSSPKSRL